MGRVGVFVLRNQHFFKSLANLTTPRLQKSGDIFDMETLKSVKRWLFFAAIFIAITTEVMSDGQKNVYGRSLAPCCYDPMTGWYRDGFCKTDNRDYGVHTVCAQMTEQFLRYTKDNGNDLSTPRLPHFPGLRPGDRWCLCVSRWKEAFMAGIAPKVVMSATHEKALQVATLAQLSSQAVQDINETSPNR